MIEKTSNRLFYLLLLLDSSNFATKTCYNDRERDFIKGVSDININNVAGIIFSNLHDRSIPELTAKRTMGAIPFGGGYRMVDFPLSAMANTGIKNISVVAGKTLINS